MFKTPPKQLDVPKLEREILEFWDRNEIEMLYLQRNRRARERFSFIDGPMTANGMMGVHHAWGRTYKDLWQRYNTMLGRRQRYQNGFDCQGLWVEVGVERELGFTSKRDIERYGIAEFVRACKESVVRSASQITQQSRRLGYFMDWSSSYYTMSDENNYAIWHFLKTCHEKGLIYRGTDVMPWCTRCGTGLSDHEVAEGYADLTHDSAYVLFPLADRTDEYLLVWTTTPWTLPANVAVAVDPDLTYLKVREGERTLFLAPGALAALRRPFEVREELGGSALVGLEYRGPFDDLPAQQGIRHAVLPWSGVSASEGTGLVHIAPGCGKEDFALGSSFDLPVIAPLDQDGVYGDTFGWLAGRNVQDVAEDVLADLRSRDLLYQAQRYTHRYPTCWRCHTPLVFRLVDEWFIAMDPVRGAMAEVVRGIRWIPPFGLERELDWLRNMDDWMISKKRYWGLALPFWLCPTDHLTVVGGRQELAERAIAGLDALESPHRPWIDEVKIRCSTCGEVAERVADVGTPWLDAGIVPFSTLKYDTDPEYWREWFPADFITESFPGQFRNWFYSLLAMSTILRGTTPFRAVLGYASLRDEQGREMHTSWGNLIPFDVAADRAGADVMRWHFCQHDPAANLNFGWESLDEVKRRLLMLWNTYSFFVTYARLDGWSPALDAPTVEARPDLDRWAIARLNELVGSVRDALDRYDAMTASRAIDHFVDDLSTWYVRLSRRRFWKPESDTDKLAAYATLYQCLTVLARVVAPFMPFISEELYQNLVRGASAGAALSVHLDDFPVADGALTDRQLLRTMEVARRVVALGRAARERAGILVRQPLARMYVSAPTPRDAGAVESMKQLILEELNVKELQFAGPDEDFLTYTVRPNLPVVGPRFGSEIPQLRAIVERLDPVTTARTLERGESLTVELNGRKIELLPSDLLVGVEQKEGFAAMAEAGYLVALDTRLTDELVREWWVREAVRRINDWRRAAGMNIEDRVAVAFRASVELDETIREHEAYICQEVLATSLRPGAFVEPAFGASAAFGGQSLEVQLIPVQSQGVP